MAYIYTMTNDELVKHVWGLESPSILEVELAQRLESLLEDYEELEELAENLSSSPQDGGAD